MRAKSKWRGEKPKAMLEKAAGIIATRYVARWYEVPKESVTITNIQWVYGSDMAYSSYSVELVVKTRDEERKTHQLSIDADTAEIKVVY